MSHNAIIILFLIIAIVPFAIIYFTRRIDIPEKPITQEQLDERNKKLARRMAELRLGSEFITEEDMDERIKQLEVGE